MEIPIYSLLKTVDESNRASEMALKYATKILTDLRELSPEGRRIMIDELVSLISGEKCCIG